MKTLEEFKSFDEYRAFLRARFKQLAEKGAPVWVSLEPFEFDKWTGTAVLLGERSAALHKALKKDLRFRQGTCVVRGKDVYVAELSGGSTKAANVTLHKLGIDFELHAGPPPPTREEVEFGKAKESVYARVREALQSAHPSAGELRRTVAAANDAAKSEDFVAALAHLRALAELLDAPTGAPGGDGESLTNWSRYTKLVRAEFAKLGAAPLPFFVSKDRTSFDVDGTPLEAHVVLAGPKARAATLPLKKEGIAFLEGTCTAEGKRISVSGVDAGPLKQAQRTLARTKLGFQIVPPAGAADAPPSASPAELEATYKRRRAELGPGIKTAIQSGAEVAEQLRALVKEAQDFEAAGRYDEALAKLDRAELVLENAQPDDDDVDVSDIADEGIRDWAKYRKWLRAELKKVPTDAPIFFYVSKKPTTFENDGATWEGYAVLAGPRARVLLPALRRAGVTLLEGMSRRAGSDLLVSGLSAGKLKQASITLARLRLGVALVPDGELPPDEPDEAEAPGTLGAGAGDVQAFRRRWTTAKAKWTGARQTVTAQLAALERALLATNDPELHAIAKTGLSLVAAQPGERLDAQLRGVDAAAGDALAEALRAGRTEILRFEQHLAGDRRVAACDENPWRVPVDLRGALAEPLREMRLAIEQFAG